MANVSKRYPLSTADGKYIPLDVIRPLSLLKVTTSNSVGSASIKIPADIELLRIKSSVDATIQFFSASTVITVVVAGTAKQNALFLPANTVVIISQPTGKNWFSIINDAAAGNCVVEYLECWNALSLQSKITRR